MKTHATVFAPINLVELASVTGGKRGETFPKGDSDAGRLVQRPGRIPLPAERGDCPCGPAW
jgi:hypothetical protein